jgi:succinate dehydrogenase / fumarate reductase cytochrome b subunit
MTTQRTRPLSPHLTIYRNPVTSYLSMANRMSLVLLSVASLALIYWLYALASGPEAYAKAVKLFSWWPAILIEMAVSVAFFYNISMEICHLFWDTAWGLEEMEGLRNALVTTALSLLMTAGFWVAIYQTGGLAS